MNTTDRHLLDRLLSVIEEEILPLTAAGVKAGNKIFGAAILRKKDLSTLVAETNNELDSPLLHGEMNALKSYYELPAKTRPTPKELLFVTTHEPCSLCLSAITWGGFDNFYYFFSHQDSRDSFAIPHDLKILKEVFNVEPGGYRRNNAFWQSHAIRDMAQQVPETGFAERVREITTRYQHLSEQYQSGKSANDIPLN